MPYRKDTLTDAIYRVLLEEPGHQAAAWYIAQKIRRQRLWARPSSGKRVEDYQVAVRAKSGSGRGWFTMEGNVVRLVKAPKGEDVNGATARSTRKERRPAKRPVKRSRRSKD